MAGLVTWLCGAARAMAILNRTVRLLSLPLVLMASSLPAFAGKVERTGFNMSDGSVRREKVHIFSEDGKDHTIKQARTGAGKVFGPIGVIQPNNPIAIDTAGKVITKDFKGSAVLLSPCYVLANYHIIYGAASGDPDPNVDHSAAFSIGDDGNGKLRGPVEATPIAHGDYGNFHNPEEDWVLLRLNKCAGAVVGWLEVTEFTLDNYKKKPVRFVYADALHASSQMNISPVCRVYERYASTSAVAHDCNAMPGSSGGIIYEQMNDGSITGILFNQGAVKVETKDDPLGEKSKIFAKWQIDKTNIGLDLRSLMWKSPFNVVEDDIFRWKMENPSVPKKSPVNAN